ncbi:PilZ domain-containing protein [Maridesulfovibrio sp.]|uniref:PilZ domain-containing protein n=1 Tax=Maridesulfovibrio sp. TaxID=2795000 RepID=UPI002A18A005|nr:PilZ domain-containing protein [Maridesulfovibrio sp.]
MDNAEKLNLIAFTDTPLAYRNFQLHSKVEIKFCADLDGFFQEALSNDFSGMIFEMKKVMNTPTRERDNIFTIAANQPLMRTRIHKNIAIFVDDPDRFLTDCVQKKKALVRQHERVKVNLQAMVSHEDDHVMVNQSTAKITNLSESGCFLTTTADLSDNHFINIKITALSNRLPICGGISWKTDCNAKLQGYGIQFIQIHQDQTQQLYDEFIKPGLRKDTTPEN